MFQKKARTQKTLWTEGFRQGNFWKTDMRHETAILGKKTKQKIQKF